MKYPFPVGASLLAIVGSKAGFPWGMPLAGTSLLAMMAFGLAGCSGLPTPPAAPSTRTAAAATRAAAVEPPASAVALTLHDGDSRIELRLDRAGALARLGHRHVIVTNAIHGAANIDPVQPANTQFKAAFRVATLEVDNREERAAAGDGFDTVLDAAAIAGTREHMLSPVLLDAERFPEIELRLQQLVAEGAATAAPADASANADATIQRFVATVVFKVKGVEHALPVPVEVAALPDGGAVASGMWTVQHADLGLTPYSAAGGLLKVADAIEIRFRLVAKPQ